VLARSISIASAGKKRRISLGLGAMVSQEKETRGVSGAWRLLKVVAEVSHNSGNRARMSVFAA